MSVTKATAARSFLFTRDTFALILKIDTPLSITTPVAHHGLNWITTDSGIFRAVLSSFLSSWVDERNVFGWCGHI